MRLVDLLPKFQGDHILKKWFWKGLCQKIRRGYTSRDIHSLDYTIINFVRPRLAAFLADVEKNRFSCPQKYLDAEWDKAKAKGFKWNEQWWRLDDKEENHRCHERAIDAWIADLRIMLSWFDDIIREDTDFQDWMIYWDKVRSYYQSKIDSAKTEFVRKRIWNEIGSFRDYATATKYGSITVTRDDCAYGYRQHAKKVFFDNFEHLWI